MKNVVAMIQQINGESPNMAMVEPEARPM